MPLNSVFTRKIQLNLCLHQERLTSWIGEIQTGIRIDSGYIEGGKVTPFYDPLISKVIVHAPTREEAIQKSQDFLSESENRRIKNEYTAIQ